MRVKCVFWGLVFLVILAVAFFAIKNHLKQRWIDKQTEEVMAMAYQLAGTFEMVDKARRQVASEQKDMGSDRSAQKLALTRKLFYPYNTEPVSWKDYFIFGVLCLEDKEFEKAQILLESASVGLAGMQQVPDSSAAVIFAKLAEAYDGLGQKENAEAARQKARGLSAK